MGEQVPVRLGEETQINAEVILVECVDKTTKLIFRNLHKQIIPKQQSIIGTPFVKRRKCLQCESSVQEKSRVGWSRARQVLL